MRTFLIIFCLLIAIPVFSQWEHQLSSDQYLNDVYSFDENTAIVIGDSGTILKTVDSGENWVLKISGTSENLNRVQFVNADHGFCIGNNGVFLKTVDGGENWTSMPGTFEYLSGISCINQDIIYLIDKYNLIKSVDGGVSFTTINSEQLNTTINFISEMVGFGTGKKTTDGGVSWSELPIDINYYEGYFSPLYFVNETVGFVMSGNDLYRTSDAGNTFNYIASFTNLHLFNLYATSTDVVWTAAMPMLDFSDCYTSRVKVSEDSSPIEQMNYGPCLKSMHFSSSTKGFAVDWFGGIYRNTTGTMLGVGEVFKNKTLSIYPNPASDHLTISFAADPTEQYTVEIAEITGKKIYNKPHQANSVEIDTESFLPGIYLLSIIADQNKETLKIVIK